MDQVDKTEIKKSETPESLYSAIEKCSEAPKDLSRENAYREALDALIRFRKVYIKLPDFPGHNENAIAGLQEVMDWCVRAIDIVDHMLDDMDRNVIEGFICKLNKLKALPASGFPKFDEAIWNKAVSRAQKVVDKYQAGKKPPKGLNPYTFSSSRTKFSGLVNVISSLKDVADIKAGRPNRWSKMFAQDSSSTIPLINNRKEPYEKAWSEKFFYEATEKIYRLMDSSYTTLLAKLEDEIFIVYEEWDKLSNTATGDLLDKYDELKGLKFQDRVNRLSRAYSIDSIVGIAIFGTNYDLVFGGESREALVDGIVETLYGISRKVKASIEQETQNMIKLFISHSSEDQELVEKLIELLKNALSLPSSEIRCTTIDGYRLPGGANTNEVLKSEVRDTKVFIGVISYAAINSMYVLFELGARWGADKHLLPLLAPGVSSGILKSPLSGLNALSCSNASQLHQLVNDLAKELEIKPEDAQAYQRYIDAILAIPPSENNNSSIDKASPENKEKPSGVKWGCYQFVSDDGLYCTACYDTKGQKNRTTRVTSKYRMCPVCEAVFGS